MINREQLIKALEYCTADECNPDCPYYEVDVGCRTKIEIDALSLLKEHEAVEPRRIDGKRNHFIKCGNCNCDLMTGFQFCPQCGREVKWDG